MKKIISLAITLVMLLSAMSTAVFADDTATDLPFEDLVEDAWYIPGIEYVYENGIMNGMSDNKFAPEGSMSRAQVVQVLFNLSGENKEDYTGKTYFEDVSENAWYTPAINWAKENGVTAGVSESIFAPNRLVTRLELVVFLNRFGFEMGCYERELADIKGYTDENKVGTWGYRAMEWAVHEGIISGTTETTLSPNANANRAQAARMFMKYNEYLKTNVSVLDNAYLMLVDHIIKNGTVDTTSAPVSYSYQIEEDGKCYRLEYAINGRITFLYGTNVVIEDKDNLADFREGIAVYIHELGSEYEYMAFYHPTKEELIASEGVFTSDGFTKDYFNYSEKIMTEEQATERISETMQELVSFMEKTLGDLGLTIDDLFIEK